VKGPSGGRGVERVVLRRPQRPLAAPRGGRPGHAPPPPRPFGSVWRQCCGHCQPRSKRTLTSSSAEADAVSQSIAVLPGKGKGDEPRKQRCRARARTMREFSQTGRFRGRLGARRSLDGLARDAPATLQAARGLGVVLKKASISASGRSEGSGGHGAMS